MKFDFYKRYVQAMFLFLFVSSVNLNAQDDEDAPTPMELLKRHIETLSSSEMGGRLPATEGNVKAADYITNEFKKAGLKPVAGKYAQEFPVPSGVSYGGTNETNFQVLLRRPGVPKEMWRKLPKNWTLDADWVPVGFSKSGTVEGEMIFVGFGISAADKNYDDYKGIDVKDKIAVALLKAPHDAFKTKNKYELKRYTDFANYTSLTYKAKNAYDHGAKAIIFVDVQSDSANRFIPLKEYPTFKNPGIIAINANRTKMSEFFPKRSLFPAEDKINKTREPQSMAIPNATVKITVNLEEKTTNIPNVIGMVAGTDPSLASETIIIGAHFDHLGWTRGGKRFTYSAKKTFIYHGADDNASGVGAMISLAGRIANNPMRRPVLFVAFNAEEGSLKGSNYYINNPVIPIEKTLCMINFDMIGKMDDDTFNALGTAKFPTLGKQIDAQLTVDSTLIVVKNETAPEPASSEAFAGKNIPSIMFFTNPHEDIHTFEDIAAKLHYRGIMRIVDFTEGLIRRIDENGI